MTFAELKAELIARGFDYLSTARQGQYINWAQSELNEADFWPYRLTTATGAAPLAIPTTSGDRGPIESVSDTTIGPIELEYYDRESLLFAYNDLTTTGTPQYWYKDTAGRVATYPASTDALSVVYWIVPADLVNASDTPTSPVRYHKTIVDMAVRMAYRDADNHEAAEALQAQIDRDVNRMRLTLGVIQNGPADYVETTERW